jgi:hypothetical protein
VREWLDDDVAFLAGMNRAKKERADRLRAEVRTLATDAVAALRKLLTGPEVPPAVRLRVALAILATAGAMEPEKVGPTSAGGVASALNHSRLIEVLGG